MSDIKQKSLKEMFDHYDEMISELNYNYTSKLDQLSKEKEKLIDKAIESGLYDDENKIIHETKVLKDEKEDS